MKFIVILFTFFLILGCTTTRGSLPAEAIQKGSLSNQQLIRDAMIGVSQKMVVLGCNKPESFEPYVLSMPQGNIGSRWWRELWIVKGCNTEYSIRIRFSESGLNAADYVVE